MIMRKFVINQIMIIQIQSHVCIDISANRTGELLWDVENFSQERTRSQDNPLHKTLLSWGSLARVDMELLQQRLLIFCFDYK